MNSLRYRALAAGFAFVTVFSGYSCTNKISTSGHVPIETGVSRQLAQHRKQQISQLQYDIKFIIPETKAGAIQASETITFSLLSHNQPLQLDFKEQSENLHKVVVNGQDLPIQHIQEHLLIPAASLQTSNNTIEIDFTAGNLSLNRSDDFLYTLLVPDRARTVFPCFDQPDLKAVFKLALTVPQNWKAIANAPLQDSTVLVQGKKSYQYLPSDTISTYLFAFAAGKFDKIQRQVKGQTMQFLHRETDEAKIDQSIDPIFKLHGNALKFMAEYTQIPYPFQKFDFVAIPDFQYNGMEHVGAIQYKAASLFLDEGATQDQKIARSSLIAHETAHMWFGDLVTMEWFNDVWMKEVFANFMADKITQQAMADSNYDLKFLIDHFPAAYSVDRTQGANPIRQELANLQDAGTLYGNIIYHKAPIVMRQLERLMGEENFRKVLQEYLKTYAHGNATWPDLIRIMDAHTPADLALWSEVWVSEPGRPLFDYEMRTEAGTISAFQITQRGEDGSDRLWPQLFEVALVYPDRIEELTVNMVKAQVLLQEAIGKPQPLYVLFNSTGQGYGLFPVDGHIQHDLTQLQNPVMRASAYINLYENMLSQRLVKPDQLLQIYLNGLTQETEELNLKLLTGQLENIFWKWTTSAKRLELAKQVEDKVWEALQKAKAGNNKKLLFNTYRSIAMSSQAQDRLYHVWAKEQEPAGVKLTEDDYTTIALALAVRDHKRAEEILASQMQRISNPDRQKRLQFILPALAADKQQRDAFFMSLKDPKNRDREAWVVTALQYLHHPLRTPSSQKYLKESLNLLEEIQLTGDIFFPQNWLGATFSSYQSPEAAQVVRQFLAEHPHYNPKLRAKILQAADGLFRAVSLHESQL
ncbi:M1 family metallopeptidase [Pontibacter sp. 13R65]|uniref:M1 family metallopeptidase n=1 Tax=Pontibacter sp. 13R65 TaxID=3127458 RepID=UPI00301BDC5D